MFALRATRRLPFAASALRRCCSGDAANKFSFEDRTKRAAGEGSSLLYSPRDADSFGLLTPSNRFEAARERDEDEGDRREEEFLSENRRRRPKLTPGRYADLIKERLEGKLLKEALDVLEVRMLREDRAPPDRYAYNLLVHACSEAGYTKKAFALYEDMKRRGLRPNHATYTSLFDACANGPWPEDGLTRARRLRERMREKRIQPNLANYNCYIKALARGGDVVGAFAVVDEMRRYRFKIRVHTLNFLLQACISDKKNGFRHALVTWRKIFELRERPNLYTFNLMLRCAKECGIGEFDPKLLGMENLLRLEPQTENNESKAETPTSSLDNSTLAIVETDARSSPVDRAPNLLAKVPHMGSVTSVGAVATPTDRFFLMGGLDGFLDELKTHGVAPDIKTFTQLLDVVPNAQEYDEKLLDRLESSNVKVDIDFFNLLMKRKCMRSDYESAKDVLNLIDRENRVRRKKCKKFPKRSMFIHPNIMTYGVRSLCCTTKNEALDLLVELKSRRLRINAQIAGTLLNNGVRSLDFDYITFIMTTARDERVVLNEKFSEILNRFNARCLRILDGKEELPPDIQDFAEKYENYRTFYKSWIRGVEKEPEDESVHPWQQFRENQPTTFQKPHRRPKKPRIYKKKGKRFVKYRVRV